MFAISSISKNETFCNKWHYQNKHFSFMFHSFNLVGRCVVSRWVEYVLLDTWIDSVPSGMLILLFGQKWHHHLLRMDNKLDHKKSTTYLACFHNTITNYVTSERKICFMLQRVTFWAVFPPILQGGKSFHAKLARCENNLKCYKLYSKKIWAR